MANGLMPLRELTSQLDKVNAALLIHKDGQTAQELLQLRDDLKQLIQLTEESLAEGTSKQKDSEPNSLHQASGSNAYHDIEANTLVDKSQSDANENQDGLDDEMAKFYAEMGDNMLDNNDNSAGTCSDSNTPQPSNTDSSLKEKIATNSNFPEKSWTATESSNSPACITDSLNDEFLDSIEKLPDISGFKCQAPFVTEWSGTQYHNAMIEGSEVKSLDSGADDDIEVKVLFLNPVMEAMVPCPYYLDGNCKFSEENCKFSHGQTASLYDLRPFIPSDYSLLTEGTRCLAKFKDGVWKPGHVEKIEGAECVVKFLHTNATSSLKIEDILPQASHSDDDDDHQLSDVDEDVVTEIVPHSVYNPDGGSSDAVANLGLWEAHTTGIGSKLMQKMGYQPGQGLGKKGQGRVEPVPIILLPQGKSLDHCMNLKLKKGIKCVDDTTDKVSQVQKLGDDKPRRRKRRNCVFTFLNKKLGDNSRREQNSAKKVAQAPKDLFGRKEGKDKKHSKMFNKEMFKNEEEMKKMQDKISKIKKSLKRNEGNPSVQKAMNVKLRELEKAMKNMKEYETNLKRHKTRVETHRKMTAF